jgi:energy-coupling factor transporter ATP-binding protein EcfA2
MRVKVSGKDYDLRVSSLPTVHGEKLVLRVLDKSNLSASIDKLGLDEVTFKQFKAAIDAPHGLILVTGPTGSGKTTTLYSALNDLNSPAWNIVTVEDPVEFQVPGINQVPTKKDIGLSFANALRSILRQDPDIIMIGEIRDTETAEIAVEAALTGHQVLSTMHCNDAPGAIARLDDMGIAPFLISSSVILSCAQRLMRRICSHCKEPVTYPAQMYEDLGIDAAMFDGTPLFRGRGCERCKNSGYVGRMAIIEVMTVSDQIRKLIIARATTREMGKLAINQGLKTLRMVALARARRRFHARTGIGHHLGLLGCLTVRRVRARGGWVAIQSPPELSKLALRQGGILGRLRHPGRRLHQRRRFGRGGRRSGDAIQSFHADGLADVAGQRRHRSSHRVKPGRRLHHRARRGNRQRREASVSGSLARGWRFVQCPESFHARQLFRCGLRLRCGRPKRA